MQFLMCANFMTCAESFNQSRKIIPLLGHSQSRVLAKEEFRLHLRAAVIIGMLIGGHWESGRQSMDGRVMQCMQIWMLYCRQ